jgi:uncharacterized protein (TIGR03435 family)
MQLRFAIAVSLISPILLALPAAQSAKPAFEVASIKRNTSGEPGQGGQTTIIGSRAGGGFRAQNATLERLILSAYTPPHATAYIAERIVGGPSWLRTLRFDVDARGADAAAAPAAYRKMLEALLEDRFGLVVHEGEVETDAYILRAARADRKPGPQLIRRTASECASRAPTAIDRLRASVVAGPDGQPLPPKPEAPPPANPFPPFQRAPVPSRGINTSGGCTPIAEIAKSISRTLKRDVSDQTGLEGPWDFTLFWTDGPGDPEVPDMFNAVQEQLGLKLDKTRGMVDILTIDAVHELVEN